MKKILPLLLVALGALTSCASGTKVSKEDYKKEADAVEDHPYTTATVTYSSTTTGKEADEDDLEEKLEAGEKNIKVKTKAVNEKENWKETYNWDASKKAWVLSGEGDGDGATMLAMTAAYYTDDELTEDYDVTYYVNPLKVNMKVEMDYSASGVTMKGKSETTMVFNKYGLLTSATGTASTTMTYSKEYLDSLAANYKTYYNVEVDFSAMSSLSEKTNAKISISYK